MTRMFQTVRRTKNPVTGCTHGCVYCWARDTANGRLKDRYLANLNTAPRRDNCFLEGTDPFWPRFWPERLKQNPGPGRVFVASMGDLFCEAVPDSWICWVLNWIRRYPMTDFLLCTKNPARYEEFEFPGNVILGTTLETTMYPNDGRIYSKAPPPYERGAVLARNKHPRKFVSIEPIMQFGVDRVSIMLRWIKEIRPGIVEVGADNHHHNLPEPSLDEVRQLLDGLRAIPGIRVVEKPGLERIKGDTP